MQMTHSPLCRHMQHWGEGAITGNQAYHVQLPQHLITDDHPICHLEAANAVAAVRTCATAFQHQLVHFYCDNDTAVHIFQAVRGRDDFLQSCAHQLWLTCASHDITLALGHIPGELLTSSADTLSRWHTGQQYKDHVNYLIRDKGVKTSLSHDKPLICHLHSETSHSQGAYMEVTQLKVGTAALATQAYRPETATNHVRQADCYIKFSDNYGLEFIDLEPSTLTYFITHLSSLFTSSKSVRNYVSGAWFLHKQLGLAP